MLVLGFIVGTLVTETAKRLYQSYFGQKEAGEDEESDRQPAGSSLGYPEDSCSSTESEENTGLCMNICKFQNGFNNCWMNAMTQAAVHLAVVKKKLMHQCPKVLAKSSTTPMFAGLFLEALKNPGKTFHLECIQMALTELSVVIPTLNLYEYNDPLDLLDPLLLWLEQHGVQSMIRDTEISRCERCKVSTSTTSVVGTTYFLPIEGEDISSLLQLAFCPSVRKCKTCGSTVETRRVWNRPDILSLYLPRLDDFNRKLVAPSGSVDIPVDEDTTQPYRLSSVICHSFNHYWTYLFFDGMTITANDDLIFVESERFPDDLNETGIIYLYEKVNMLT